MWQKNDKNSDSLKNKKDLYKPRTSALKQPFKNNQTMIKNFFFNSKKNPKICVSSVGNSPKPQMTQLAGNVFKRALSRQSAKRVFVSKKCPSPDKMTKPYSLDTLLNFFP